jgi:hypothetical protein
VLEELPHHVLRRRLREIYSPTYLTILSIIQGVALGGLASVVASAHDRFTIVDWVMALDTFCVLIIIWNVFTVQIGLWNWIPDMRDGAIVFAVGAGELFLGQAIVGSMSTWLIALALIGVVGAVGTVHIVWRGSHEPESAELLTWLERHIRIYILYLVGGTGILLLLALICHLAGVEPSLGVRQVRGVLACAVSLVTTAALGGAIVVFNALWRHALHYIHHGATPAPVRRWSGVVACCGGRSSTRERAGALGGRRPRAVRSTTATVPGMTGLHRGGMEEE